MANDAVGPNAKCTVETLKEIENILSVTRQEIPRTLYDGSPHGKWDEKMEPYRHDPFDIMPQFRTTPKKDLSKAIRNFSARFHTNMCSCPGATEAFTSMFLVSPSNTLMTSDIANRC